MPQTWFRNHFTMRDDIVVRKNDPDNIVPLCKHCHHLVDGQLPKKVIDKKTRDFRKRDARMRLRQILTEHELAYIVAVRSTQWLNSHYPCVVPSGT